MSLFCKVEMSPKITASKGVSDGKRGSVQGDKQGIEETESARAGDREKDEAEAGWDVVGAVGEANHPAGETSSKRRGERDRAFAAWPGLESAA